MEQLIEEIMSRCPGQKIVLLAATPDEAHRLRDYVDIAGGASELLVSTPLELALDILEPDIKMRGLKPLSNDRIIDVLEEITASLAERGELENWRGAYQIADWLPNIYARVIKMRRSGLDAREIGMQFGRDDPTLDLVGRILNEYELALEAWGCLDEAAVFSQAAGILETGMVKEAGRIIIVAIKNELEPVVLHFLKALIKHGCTECFSK